jgi:succinoglycan biosynthesis protein ExoV
MPHFESAGGGLWEQAAAAAGITLIDPRGDPRSIMTAIAGCQILLSEALHGVIVADTLTVPWVAIEPLAPIHRPKWGDWAETLGLAITFAHLSPSSLLEHASLSRLAAYHTGRRLLACRGEWLRRRGTGYFVDRAAAALRRAAQAEPQLSARAALDRSTSRMLGRLDELRRVHLRTGAGTDYQNSTPGFGPRRMHSDFTRAPDPDACSHSPAAQRFAAAYPALRAENS